MDVSYREVSVTLTAIGADGTVYIGNYGDNKVYALNPDGPNVGIHWW